MTQFEGQHLALPPDAFNGDLGDSYRAWLVATCKILKTARDRLTAIKSLLKFATDTLEWLPTQPWRGLDIKATTTHERQPWTPEELTTLFGTPLHQWHPSRPSLARRSGGPLGAPAGALHGCPPGGALPATRVDVQTVGGLPVLVLTDDGEDQRSGPPDRANPQ